MNDIIDIANEIESKITELHNLRNKLNEIGNNKAISVSNYDKEIAKTIINLRNGIIYILDGVEIKEPPVSLIDKLAKGICYKERIDMDVADNNYKSLSITINCIQAELNALQSLFRRLDNR